jgi:uncharacterized membrane protein
VGIRLGALVERLRSSLFFVPMLFVLLGAGLGTAMIEVDRVVGDGAADLPFVLTTTVDGARDVLSVVASATITVAGIAFSISLLVIQQASAQFSPRVVHSLFRDPFNRRVMGLAVGTFTYCLMVLRTVRGPLEEGGEPVIPNASVGVAVALGVAAILAIVAFIDHNAHTLEVSEILSRVTGDTIHQLQASVVDEDDGPGGDAPDGEPPPGPGHTVALVASGWLQQVDAAGLLDLVPDGGTVRLETEPGRYAVRGTPLCTLWPHPEDADEAAERAARCTRIGAVRTMQQDASYGVRQLADVALIALSPGVNDPTTAQDAIFHLTAVLREGLVRDLPPTVERDERGRRLLRSEAHTHETLVELAFDEVRRAAAALPTVCTYLLEALHLLEVALVEAGCPERAGPLRAQAELVLAGAERAELLPADLAAVRHAFTKRFGHRSSAG